MTRGKRVSHLLRMGGPTHDGRVWAEPVVRMLVRLRMALASLALASLGCGAPGTTLVFDDAATGLPEAFTVACPETVGPPELLEALEDARSAWADVGVDTSGVCVSAISYGSRAGVAEACGYPGFNIDGCSHQSAQTIDVGDWLSARRQGVVVKHELGHLIAGFTGHLKCLDQPGDGLMCPTGGPDEPTERDAAFVLRQLDAAEREGLP